MFIKALQPGKEMRVASCSPTHCICTLGRHRNFLNIEELHVVYSWATVAYTVHLLPSLL